MQVITPSGQKTVAITGATGGIGRELCRQFAEAGYSVAAIGRDHARLGEVARLHPRIAAFAADVGHWAECRQALQSAEQALGPIGVLVAAAAIYPKAHFLDQSAEELATTMRINVEGVANAVRAVLPDMLARNFGRIVVFGSLADLHPLPGSLAYSVSKGALHTLVRAIAVEIDRDRYPGVLINEFSPGATRTAMSEFGHDPAEIFEMMIGLIECDSNGPQGQFYQEGRQIRIGESWKAALKRIILRN